MNTLICQPGRHRQRDKDTNIDYIRLITESFECHTASKKETTSTKISAIARWLALVINGCCYPHMPIGMLGIYRLLFVCLFFVCPQDFGNVITDISAVD